ncbi:DNA/RNA helicase domain-containing protein [Psychrobacillus psychrodurans]|uniref:DNA/RNA helicase domain-containing protein n=1 Tax=Psychrobacillus psychrodurans TaxID=126157 RepID=UPI0008E77EB5|nr:DNA/RNA helicase domain-containing protein [Psychrobacillus psychrodurans]MCZ8540287.1 DUF2075 domain-containing protein [Psychrobacillus psychrodurans]SFM61244.1 8-oxo-dGTP diphosphatase [Psychrobacillus psychrodurans]
MSKEFVEYTVYQLKEMPRQDFINELGTFTTSLDFKYSTSQEKSWGDCYDYLNNEFQNTTIYDQCILLFEYCLPFTNYRRPDVIMLFNGKVIVLEFKRKDIDLIQDVDQLRGYLNFLRKFHDETQRMNLLVEGALILTTNNENHIVSAIGFTLIKGKGLINLLNDFNNRNPLDRESSLLWANSSYEPSKNVLKATFNMFMNDDLSMIKNISEHELQNVLDVLHRLTIESHQKKRLIFLTGVPGAGKTLALLHTLYKLNEDRFRSVFLTGNGPLEKVLSYLLSNAETGADGEALIKGVLAYKKAYFNRGTKQPFLNRKIPSTILFDEAQRAWNEKQMGASYGMSEPELILKVQGEAASQNGYTNIVASIGFGQSIYKGEEDEFETWVKVLEKSNYQDWEIYAPSNLKGKLGHLSNIVYVNDLNLATSIRSNFIDTSSFIEAVLNADVITAKEEYQKLCEQGYFIHMVDNLNSAKRYLEKNAIETGDKFYGLISSSNMNLNDHKQFLGNARMIQQSDTKETIGKWYFKDSSKLDAIATEFVCQGLELNIPIVYFGGDFLVNDEKWQVKPTKHYEDRETTIRNIYRVLLSRGRIGMLLFVPNKKDCIDTLSFLKNIGIERYDI